MALGLVGWAASFLLTGLVVAPLLAALEGVSLRSLDTAQQTEYVLAVQSWETVQGIAIIWACVRSYQPLPPDLFRVDACVRAARVLVEARRVTPERAGPLRSSKPFSPENGWAVWGLLGYGATFVAIGTAAGAAALFEQASTAPAGGAGNGTVDAILPLVRRRARSAAAARGGS